VPPGGLTAEHLALTYPERKVLGCSIASDVRRSDPGPRGRRISCDARARVQRACLLSKRVETVVWNLSLPLGVAHRRNMGSIHMRAKKTGQETRALVLEVASQGTMGVAMGLASHSW